MTTVSPCDGGLITLLQFVYKTVAPIYETDLQTEKVIDPYIILGCVSRM